MQVLKNKDDALYTQLLRLAGGDTGIVMQVLSRPDRPSVSLGTVIDEIERLRDRRSPVVAGAARTLNGGSHTLVVE
jgi:hypothetical protein